MQDTSVSHERGRQIRVGCSGWNYKHWRELFYPKGLPARRWFEFYAGHFDTVEINNSFYRLPSPETFDKWREQAPPGFCYAVKANRYITQAKKLLDPEEPLDRMMSAALHLGSCLGPILYQLPPSLGLDLERLEHFLAILPKDVTSVFEFRDRSWYVSQTYDLLERYGASFCAHDMPGSATERIAVGPIAYIRFHGCGRKYWGRYPHDLLLRWANWMTELASVDRPVWAYFNNDIDGHAILDAQTLKAMIGQLRR